MGCGWFWYKDLLSRTQNSCLEVTLYYITVMGFYSQITHSLMNTACPLLMLSSMIKNVWIAPEIEENIFVQYKNLPFLKPAEIQGKRITKLVSHNQLGWAFSHSQTHKNPSPHRHVAIALPIPDMTLSHPSYSHTLSRNLFSAAFLKCSRITFLAIQWTRSGNWCSWKQTCFPTGCFQVVSSLCSTVDAWGRWKK